MTRIKLKSLIADVVNKHPLFFWDFEETKDKVIDDLTRFIWNHNMKKNKPKGCKRT